MLVGNFELVGTPERDVPELLRYRLLHPNHYAVMTCSQGGPLMYCTLKREYCWAQMAGDVLSTVRGFLACTWLRRTNIRHQKLKKLFLAAGPLEFVAKDVIGPMEESAPKNTFNLAITDRCTDAERFIPLWNTKAAIVAAARLDYAFYAYGSSRYIFTDNGKHLVVRLSDSMCGTLSAKNYLTTAYHSETNGQTEQFSTMTFWLLRHYVANQHGLKPLLAVTCAFV